MLSSASSSQLFLALTGRLQESNDPFEWVSFDGILGLGLDSLAPRTPWQIAWQTVRSIA